MGLYHNPISIFIVDPSGGDDQSSVPVQEVWFCKRDAALQVIYSILDQVYHGNHPLYSPTQEIQKEL